MYCGYQKCSGQWLSSYKASVCLKGRIELYFKSQDSSLRNQTGILKVIVRWQNYSKCVSTSILIVMVWISSIVVGKIFFLFNKWVIFDRLINTMWTGFCFLFLFLIYKFSLSSSGQPGTHYAARVGLSPLIFLFLVPSADTVSPCRTTSFGFLNMKALEQLVANLSLNGFVFIFI